MCIRYILPTIICCICVLVKKKSLYLHIMRRITFKILRLYPNIISLFQHDPSQSGIISMNVRLSLTYILFSWITCLNLFIYSKFV